METLDSNETIEDFLQHRLEERAKGLSNKEYQQIMKFKEIFITENK